jgi:RNA polymerase sigma factor for flagellar operon FliA
LCFRHLWKTKEAAVNYDPDVQISKLIEETLPLVKSIVFQVSVRFPRHTDQEELAQAGVIGLVQAAHRFDPSKGVRFSHFAAQRIRGAILDAVRALDWAPRSVRRAGRSIEAVTEALANELGRTPTSTEIAAALGVSGSELAHLQHQVARSTVLALDLPLYEVDVDSDDEMMLGGALTDRSAINPQEDLEHRELHSYLHDAVDALPERHRIIVQGYFFDGRSSEELARELGVTASRVSQLRTEAFAMLRDGINAQYHDPEEEPAVLLSGPERIRRQAAYAAAIAAQSTWRSRLDAGQLPVGPLEMAV